MRLEYIKLETIGISHKNRVRKKQNKKKKKDSLLVSPTQSSGNISESN